MHWHNGIMTMIVCWSSCSLTIKNIFIGQRSAEYFGGGDGKRRRWRRLASLPSIMLPACPPDLHHLLPYLQRAAELKGREPIISFYCTFVLVVRNGSVANVAPPFVYTVLGAFYAAKLALTNGYPRLPENDTFLGALFDQLEQVRPSQCRLRLPTKQNVGEASITSRTSHSGH
jgi:hypothetical protein